MPSCESREWGAEQEASTILLFPCTQRAQLLREGFLSPSASQCGGVSSARLVAMGPLPRASRRQNIPEA